MPAAVTPQRAQQLFSLVSSRLCCPVTSPAPCIPFLYPDDGCWGRAHEMCRLMIADGADPEKVWIYGGLTVSSANKPDCVVNWGWHVAPTLQVNTASGIQIWVIDPSLFTGPVPRATWGGAQGDPNAVLEASPATFFYRGQGGSPVFYDPTYAETNDVLTTYRNALKLRSAAASGPPPYLQCLTMPPRVQFLGALGAGQTGQWFTWGWNPAWHVLWTIMPLTPCPGSPQLTWSVRVERATATQCTYWILVTNLKQEPVKFEGRYDILKT